METSTGDTRWKELYTLAGVAAIVSEVVILLGIVGYIIWPYAPGTKSTESIFLLLQSDPLGGLVSLDLLLLVSNIFGILLFLAFYVSLRQVNESYALIALALGLVGVVLLVPSRPIVELFALSGRYAAATTEAAKGELLGAGAALLALFDGINWFMNTLLGGISLLISSVLMLRSAVYSRRTAYVGILTNIVVCGFFIPVLGKIFLFLSLPGYLIWYFLLARTFLRMAKPVKAGTLT